MLVLYKGGQVVLAFLLDVSTTGKFMHILGLETEWKA